MGAPRAITIVGAGIAGLTLALGLAKFGLQVLVIERNASLSEFGAGLQISPNARKPLDRLGLADSIEDRSFSPSGIDIFPGTRAQPLQTLALGEEIAERFGAPYAVMHRADLVETLFAAAKRFANIDIAFGVNDLAIDTEGDRLEVRFTDAEDMPRRARPFALIGADGVRSAVRTQVLGGPDARYTGKIAWRALVPTHALDETFDLRRTALLLNSNYHLVVYPLPQRNAVNLALFTHQADPNPSPLVAPTIHTRGNRRLEVVMTAVGDGWTPWVLSEVMTDTWSRGPVGIIGDAAHAMLPFQAQGAAMAIEDAAVLAPLLAASPNAEHAFTRYAALRKPRVGRVQEVSRANGRIFHMRAPLSLARDLVIRASGPRDHFRRLDWVYGYDPHVSS
ncbi:FAD-dependent oxidoreductase [Pelagibacterium luteolum]|uniref:Salicylate hydroxylase n=1 Tax=Pelagibacterium luteolum TaxID=440168 RepID=A0A1G7XG59_9HYPH|nr:FAD-dependent oxidoreductase [Pelagibacterium luteolum]SDG83265.1 salicylate hydroxylase [Pelagibacterium luteolum]